MQTHAISICQQFRVPDQCVYCSTLKRLSANTVICQVAKVTENGCDACIFYMQQPQLCCELGFDLPSTAPMCVQYISVRVQHVLAQ